MELLQKWAKAMEDTKESCRERQENELEVLKVSVCVCVCLTCLRVYFTSSIVFLVILSHKSLIIFSQFLAQMSKTYVTFRKNGNRSIWKFAWSRKREARDNNKHT